MRLEEAFLGSDIKREARHAAEAKRAPDTFSGSLQILIKATMLNCLARFFFADLSGKTTSGILRDNYFARERKPKLTRPVRGSNGTSSLRISALHGNRKPAIRVPASDVPVETPREYRNNAALSKIEARSCVSRERTLSPRQTERVRGVSLRFHDAYLIPQRDANIFAVKSRPKSR